MTSAYCRSLMALLHHRSVLENHKIGPWKVLDLDFDLPLLIWTLFYCLHPWQCFCENTFFAFWPDKVSSRCDGIQSVRLLWCNKITAFEVFEESSQYITLLEYACRLLVWSSGRRKFSRIILAINKPDNRQQPLWIIIDMHALCIHNHTRPLEGVSP